MAGMGAEVYRSIRRRIRTVFIMEMVYGCDGSRNPLYLILYYAFNLYTPKRVQGRRLEFSKYCKSEYSRYADRDQLYLRAFEGK